MVVWRDETALFSVWRRILAVLPREGLYAESPNSDIDGDVTCGEKKLRLV